MIFMIYTNGEDFTFYKEDLIEFERTAEEIRNPLYDQFIIKNKDGGEAVIFKHGLRSVAVYDFE